MPTLDLLPALNARHALPGIAQIVEGANGLPKIHITTPQASAELYLHGAHLTSWKPEGQGDVLPQPPLPLRPRRLLHTRLYQSERECQPSDVPA